MFLRSTGIDFSRTWLENKTDVAASLFLCLFLCGTAVGTQIGSFIVEVNAGVHCERTARRNVDHHEDSKMSEVTPRKGMPSPRLSESEFRRRFLDQFADPAYGPLAAELDKIAGAAWDAYDHSRKAPRTRKAGGAFADPNYDLSLDWLAATPTAADLSFFSSTARRAASTPAREKCRSPIASSRSRTRSLPALPMSRSYCST
jgi:hypothetical protein